MISGTPVSLAPDGTALVIGASTKPLALLPMQGTVTANALTFNPGLGSALVAGKQTITPGAPAVMVSGTPVSFALDRTAVVVGLSTKSLPTAGAATPSNILAGAFTFTRGSGSDLVIGIQTITTGAPAVTISGTPVSLALDGTAVVVGSSTKPLPAAEAATQGIFIAGALSFQTGSGSALVVSTQTIPPGAPALPSLVPPTTAAVAPRGNEMGVPETVMAGPPGTSV